MKYSNTFIILFLISLAAITRTGTAKDNKNLNESDSVFCERTQIWGFHCNGCSNMVKCIKSGDTWYQIDMGSCEENMYCSQSEKQCSTIKDCQDFKLTANIGFYSEARFSNKNLARNEILDDDTEDTTITEEVTTPTEEDTTPTEEDTTPTEEDTTPTEEDTTPTEEDTTPTAEDTTTTQEDTTTTAEVSKTTEEVTTTPEEVTTTTEEDETTTEEVVTTTEKNEEFDSKFCEKTQKWGFQCDGCTNKVKCIQSGLTWITADLGKCPKDTYCNEEKMTCTTQKDCKERDTGTVDFKCYSYGVFPNPYDCQSYFVCAEPASFNLEPLKLNCPVGYAFNSATNRCNIPISEASYLCDKPQFVCRINYEMKAWPANNKIYYMCVQKDPAKPDFNVHLYACKPKLIFDNARQRCV